MIAMVDSFDDQLLMNTKTSPPRVIDFITPNGRMKLYIAELQHQKT